MAHLGCMAMMSYLIFTLSAGCVTSPPNSSFSPAVSDATRVRYVILHTAWGGAREVSLLSSAWGLPGVGGRGISGVEDGRRLAQQAGMAVGRR